MRQMLKRFRDVCEAAIELDEMSKPGPYTPPTDQEISDAEQALGIRFPKDFVQFHRECDGYRLPFWEIFDLTGKPKSATHMIGANLSNRRAPPKGISLPERLVAFYSDGGGNLLCFDTAQRDSRGNYAIVLWDHEEPDADPDDLEVWSDTFTEWLEDHDFP
ncbi:MAG: SMI1/KNR4 family protein, partial [Planctomycetes bacterium]|nr:SMI1/KNR4 family protein [Planctomycetota bacterium]